MLDHSPLCGYFLHFLEGVKASILRQTDKDPWPLLYMSFVPLFCLIFVIFNAFLCEWVLNYLDYLDYVLKCIPRSSNFLGFIVMQEGDFEMKHIDRLGSPSFNVAIAPFSLSTLGDDSDSFWNLKWYCYLGWSGVTISTNRIRLFSNWSFAL